MKLVPQWQNAYKWFSVHALMLAGVLPATWCSLPDSWRAIVPISYIAVATGITSVLGILGRLADQPSMHPPENRP